MPRLALETMNMLIRCQVLGVNLAWHQEGDGFLVPLRMDLALVRMGMRGRCHSSRVTQCTRQVSRSERRKLIVPDLGPTPLSIQRLVQRAHYTPLDFERRWRTRLSKPILAQEHIHQQRDQPPRQSSPR
jgi:hypothetical protein